MAAGRGCRPAARATDATAGSGARRTGPPTASGPFAGSMAVRLRQVPPRQIAVAFEQPGLVRVERLLNAADEPLLGRARSFERVARPDDEIGAPSGSETADLAAHSDCLR